MRSRGPCDAVYGLGQPLNVEKNLTCTQSSMRVDDGRRVRQAVDEAQT